MIKGLILITVAIGALGFLASCDIIDQGRSCGHLESVELKDGAPDLGGCVLTVAVENAYQPFNFIDTSTNQGVGYDYDIFDEICSRVNCETRFVETTWEAMVAIMAGKGESGIFDVGANGITITEKRAQNVDFSLPYITSSQVLLARIEESRFTEPEGFSANSGLKIGTQLGTTNYEAAARLVGEERIVTFDQFGLAVQALIAGDVDAVMIDSVAGQGYVGVNADSVKVTGRAVESEELGFIFETGSLLVAPVNWALEQIENDGTGELIYGLWFN